MKCKDKQPQRENMQHFNIFHVTPAHVMYTQHLTSVSAAVREEGGVGGPVQVGERHVSMERRLAAAGGPVTAAAPA